MTHPQGHHHQYYTFRTAASNRRVVSMLTLERDSAQALLVELICFGHQRCLLPVLCCGNERDTGTVELHRMPNQFEDNRSQRNRKCRMVLLIRRDHCISNTFEKIKTLLVPLRSVTNSEIRTAVQLRSQPGGDVENHLDTQPPHERGKSRGMSILPVGKESKFHIQLNADVVHIPKQQWSELTLKNKVILQATKQTSWVAVVLFAELSNSVASAYHQSRKLCQFACLVPEEELADKEHSGFIATSECVRV
ncbi:hypothetical protein CLF_106725 [Clonorchis sinensis]|uniref:Uncharacterized protein n=1 Tax=Clonorchis sinensis TaxID=79923 RepID=G7YFK9_CLOSI|nr:hypothetical protein CLF_106725 [Clonorchis sinensis]